MWDHYANHSRSMPWRDNTDPYWVMVSEIMLQQTQVNRVEPKFTAFIEAFPAIDSLAAASLADVLRQWSGLGYNRRAKFLWQAAGQIMSNHKGLTPSTVEELDALPGIGRNTAAAIMNYAYNQPVAFVETNVRTVLLHHFFPNQLSVTDATLLEVAELVLDHENPKQWHWALMDYGSHIKSVSGARLDQSAAYKKQSPLAGSVREMRGRVLRVLLSSEMDEMQLRKAVQADERFDHALQALINEQLVSRKGNTLGLTGEVIPNIIGLNK